MKLATYDAGQGARVGIVVGDALVDAGEQGSMVDLMTRWEDVRADLAQREAHGTRRPLREVRLCAPVLRPGKIFAIGLNYRDHIAESGVEAPKRQVWFTKAQTSINGPFDPILIARDAPYVDYEVELVAVIGKRGKHIPAARARAPGFGYCVGNDVTERMWQHASPQWSLGKSFDTHAPIGPWITTADEIGDPHALELRCLVNGEQRQHSSTKHLVFDLWQQIEHLSAAMTLEPGDIVFTGTPGGVGAAMEPRVFLKPGDVVRCEIEKLGEISGVLASEA